MLKAVSVGGDPAADITIGSSIITGGTDTRFLYDDAGVVGESAGLTYDKTAGTVTATIPSANVTTPYFKVIWDGNTALGVNPRMFVVDAIDNTSHGAHMELLKALGTRASKLPLGNGSSLGGYCLSGWDGLQYTQGAVFGGRVSGTVSAGGTLPTTAFVIVNAVEMLTIDYNGLMKMITPAVSSTRESVFNYTVSGSGNDVGFLSNGTNVDSVFLPAVGGYVSSTNSVASLRLHGLIPTANDNTASNPIVDVLVATTDSATNPNGGAFSDITTRPLFRVRSVTGEAMVIRANYRTDFGKDIGLTEMTAPSAPAANGVYIYAVDNGGGKTQLMALFSSGAAQQIAIQP